MAADVEAIRARKAALKERLLAQELAQHGPHRVHPPRRRKPAAQKQWADRMVAFAEQHRQRIEREEQRQDAEALRATRPRVPAFTGRDLGKFVIISGDDVMLITGERETTTSEMREVEWRGAHHFDLEGKIEGVEPWVGGSIAVEGLEENFANPEIGKLDAKGACERNHSVAEAYEQRKEALARRFYPPARASPKLQGARLEHFLERNRAAHERDPDPDEEGDEQGEDDHDDVLSPVRRRLLGQRLQARDHRAWRVGHIQTVRDLEAREAAKLEFLGLRPDAPKPAMASRTKPSPPTTPPPAHRPAPRRPATSSPRSGHISAASPASVV